MRRLCSACAAGLAIMLGAPVARPTPAAAQDRTPSRVFPDDWSEGKTRLFVGFGAAAGSQARTDLTLGYGKPYWTWIGVEADGQTTADMAMTRLRARLALVVADLAVGWGRVWAYRHTTLPAAPRYDALTAPHRGEARYHSLQIWLAGFIPAPHGYVDWQLEALRVYGLDAGDAVYEEQLRAVVRPSWALASRLGYTLQFADKRGTAGVLAEALWPGDRGDYIARIGPTMGWAFSPRFDLALSATMTVHSPDDLSVYEALWGTLRARYRTASR